MYKGYCKNFDVDRKFKKFQFCNNLSTVLKTNLTTSKNFPEVRVENIFQIYCLCFLFGFKFNLLFVLTFVYEDVNFTKILFLLLSYCGFKQNNTTKAVLSATFQVCSRFGFSFVNPHVHQFCSYAIIDKNCNKHADRNWEETGSSSLSQSLVINQKTATYSIPNFLVS